MVGKQPETLLKQSFASVIQLVLKLSTDSKAVHHIEKIVESLPCTLVDKFASTVIPKLKCPSAELLQSCIHPAVSILDMEGWQIKLQNQVCRIMPRLKIKKLTLSCAVPKLWLSSRLVSFSFQHYCTDNIIRALAVTCKSLTVLNIRGSYAVTNNSVNFLLELQQLQDVNVSGVGFTFEAFSWLLFGLRKLRRWQGCERLKKVYGCSESLEKYTSMYLYVEGSLSDYFPNLTCVVVSSLLEPGAMLLFGSLKHLQHLTVGYSYEYDLGMREFVDVYGKQLLTFSISDLKEMDFLHFAMMCPELQKLRLEECFVSCASSEELKDLPHFHSVWYLEVVVLDDSWFTHGFEFPFFVYSNLQYLIAVNMRDLSDITVHHAVTEHNWLRELQTLEVYGVSGYLSYETYNLLVKHCPHLRSVGYLADWDGMSLTELTNLYWYSKSHPLNINL